MTPNRKAAGDPTASAAILANCRNVSRIRRPRDQARQRAYIGQIENKVEPVARSSPSRNVTDQRQEEKHQKYEEQKLRQTRGGDGDSRKTNHRGQQRD